MILAYFSKNLTNFAVISCPFGRNCKLWKIFQNFSKNFLVQLLKTHHFSEFSKNLIIHAFVFKILRIYWKTPWEFGWLLGILDNYDGIFRKFAKSTIIIKTFILIRCFRGWHLNVSDLFPPFHKFFPSQITCI